MEMFGKGVPEFTELEKSDILMHHDELVSLLYAEWRKGLANLEKY